MSATVQTTAVSAPSAAPATKPARWNQILHPLAPAELVEEAAHHYAPWIETCVNPGAKQRDRAGAPIERELMRQAGMLGLLGYTLPVEVGGLGRTWRDWGFTLHEIGYYTDDTALPMLLAYCSTVTKLLYDTGRTDLIRKYVRPMVRGELLGGFAWSEGHDPFSFKTTLTRTDTGYVLTGAKTPIANGLIADVIMVFATDAETGDVVTVLVERSDAGVEIEGYNAMGLRSAGLAAWRFHNVALPADRVIVGDDGLSWGQRFLNERRLEMPCWALGRMKRLFESCVKDMATRIRYERPLTEMQTIQAALGKMTIALESSRIMVRATLDRIGDEGCDFLWEPQLAILKSHVIEQALHLVRVVQDITGGYAVFEGAPYERTIRDLQCLNPIAGTLATLQVDLGILAADEIQRQQRAQTHNRRKKTTHGDQTVRQSPQVLEFPKRDRG
ncbi:MAG: acyl-CoA dehydrogenase family protein [Kofleriaceae bacterium]